MPTGPGVYLFRDAAEQVLYVGKATDLRARVRSYFSGRALRAPVERAVEAAARVETRPLGSEFEAALLELELIERLRPPANTRGADPDRACYLVLTLTEPVPRLRVSARPGGPGDVTAGPLRSRSQAEAVAAAMRETFGLRVCRPALPVDDGSCLAGVVGTCRAPCRGGPAVDAYAAAVGAAQAWLEGDDGGGPQERVRDRMGKLSADRRYEQAAAARDQLAALERGRRALARLRRSAGRSGVVLAPDVDGRFVQAFACAGGRVVARRRLPRAGDGRLEADALVAALAHGLRSPPAPFSPAQADQARVVAAALARPSPSLRAVAVDRATRLGGDGATRPAAADGTLAEMNFGDRVAEAVERKQSCLCVGLDPRIDLLPPEVITGLHPGASGRARAYERFCSGVIDAVADEAVAVKPQVAFFEALGGVGISALERVCAHARDAGLLVVVDGKRGDIDSTAEAYAQAWLHRRDGAAAAGDALTVNPYLGEDSLAPFLAACGEGSGLFVLTRTSNPGGADVQEAELEGGGLVWERIASLVAALGRGARSARAGCRRWAPSSARPSPRRSSARAS